MFEKESGMGKIFIAGEIPEAGYEALKDHELDVYKGEKLIGEEELLMRSRDTDAILSLLSTQINKKIIDNAEKVKIIAKKANSNTGVVNTDVVHCIHVAAIFIDSCE